MSEKNLPIQMILPREKDRMKNTGRKKIKFFEEFNSELQAKILEKFKNMEKFYENVFYENSHIPAVGKIKIKEEAIAKSYKPNKLCQECKIIGGASLNEIYIKVDKKSIEKTINLVKKASTKEIQANLTTIEDIVPIVSNEKISNNLISLNKENLFSMVKEEIKIKLFDFEDEFDNFNIFNYVKGKLKKILKDLKEIKYGDNIKFLKVTVNSFEDIKEISNINGIKYIDSFQEYSLPVDDFSNEDFFLKLEGEEEISDITIGIIDGGISPENTYLNKYVIGREEYVPLKYRNYEHATFIASIIECGNALNQIKSDTINKRFKLLDIIAIPNGDKSKGITDTLREDQLMEVIEEVMKKYSSKVKIWNLSLGNPNKICNGEISDLAIFLDYIQDKYNVQIFVSSGNFQERPYRNWPSQITDDSDRIISPADSIRAITVGSVALFDSKNSIVKKGEPSPFSRRGPGANYNIKPDLVDYGGNLSLNKGIYQIGIKGLDINGKIIEGVGTSYSTPKIAQKYAAISDEINEGLSENLLLNKALLIHSARMSSRELLDKNLENINYFGYGKPSEDIQEILYCSKDEVTLIFNQKIIAGSHLEMIDFPYPKSLIRNGKYFGEIGMTLVYKPLLDKNYGNEYCRTNIDVSFGTYSNKNGEIKFEGQVPLETTWSEKKEKYRVEHGFKWSPIKSYYRKIKNGIKESEGWKIRIDMVSRNGVIVKEQEFVLIISIRDPQKNDIYSDIINGLREKGYITTNLETKQQLRAKNIK